MRKLDHLLKLLAVGTIVISLSALAAGEWWVLELTAHFRGQYLAAQATLLLLLALRARWLWCLTLLPVMVLNVVPLAPYWPRQTMDDPLLGDPLTVMSANLNNSNTDYGRFLGLLEAAPPDIVLLVEFNAGWGEAARRLHTIYPHRIEIPKDDRYGIALFSRRPFLNQRSIRLQSTSAIDVRVSVSGRSVRVLGVHLRSPTSRAWSEERNRQLAELTAIARRETDPLLVLGDFNISPYSPIFASTLAASGLRDSRRGRSWYFTWPTFLPLLGIPIDLCMLSEHFAALDSRRGPSFGSDHYPMSATVALR